MRAIWVRVQTKTRWEFVGEHLRLTPVAWRAAIYRSTEKALAGLAQALIDYPGTAERFELCESADWEWAVIHGPDINGANTSLLKGRCHLAVRMWTNTGRMAS